MNFAGYVIKVFDLGPTHDAKARPEISEIQLIYIHEVYELNAIRILTKLLGIKIIQADMLAKAQR